MRDELTTGDKSTWQGRAAETEESQGQRRQRKMGFKEEGAAKRARARETERAVERERELERETLWGPWVFATRGLPMTPIDSSLERGAKLKLQQVRGS